MLEASAQDQASHRGEADPEPPAADASLAAARGLAAPPELSVLVPAYNEGATLETIVRRVLDVELDLEVIIIDDGSTDETPVVADSLARREPCVTALHLPRNSGKGAALRHGLAAARGAYVVVQDGDLEYDPRDFVLLLAEMRRLDSPVVYGSRRKEYRSASVQRSYYWGGVLVTTVTNALFGARLTDEPTCYKMWRRDLIQSIPLRANGFDFCPEITAKVLKRGIDIPEVQIHYAPRRRCDGKKIRFRDGLLAVWTLLRERLTR